MTEQRMPFGRPRMGFGKTAVRREFKSHKGTVCVGGKVFSKDSDLEERYAGFLEMLKVSGSIRDWFRPAGTFTFAGAVRGATVYTPDFRVIERDGTTVYHELKGYIQSSDITKFRRLQEFYPGTAVDLFMQSIPGPKAKNFQRVQKLLAAARKYCRRVVTVRAATGGLV
jgi:hypothetical protein